VVSVHTVAEQVINWLCICMHDIICAVLVSDGVVSICNNASTRVTVYWSTTAHGHTHYH
jgi:hypothetical protein